MDGDDLMRLRRAATAFHRLISLDPVFDRTVWRFHCSKRGWTSWPLMKDPSWNIAATGVQPDPSGHLPIELMEECMNKTRHNQWAFTIPPERNWRLLYARCRRPHSLLMIKRAYRDFIIAMDLTSLNIPLHPTHSTDGSQLECLKDMLSHHPDGQPSFPVQIRRGQVSKTMDVDHHGWLWSNMRFEGNDFDPLLLDVAVDSFRRFRERYGISS
ncbi:hypothetical protein PROFUN_01087 [Planoprotostelium fungivorum]|uniref:Uncharacterized protein n=1 Tax=Planoprotostelium fungivorum TaxID=1890364 RepID=A0A2P6NCA5_9EUKA|nr:hypothetical protein PROFUN_01087 [Planoprotostelium fungivorum]